MKGCVGGGVGDFNDTSWFLSDQLKLNWAQLSGQLGPGEAIDIVTFKSKL